MTRWRPPSEFDEYRLLRELGRGGMGQVFLARDELLDREVAIKFIAGDAVLIDDRERFLIEARAAARLQHPNVVTVHRVGQIEGRPFLVSELIRGRSLDRIETPLTGRRALEIGVALARGLAAAHRRGVLHRDIKPANAIVSDAGEVKLLDFGLAKLLEGGVAWRTADSPADARAIAFAVGGDRTPPADRTANADGATLTEAPRPGAGSPSAPSAPAGHTASLTPETATGLGYGAASDGPGLTAAGVVLGTPYYMAPEVWAGEAATRQADVYALDALLYTLCTGRPPHRDVPRDQLAAVLAERDAPPVAERAPALDPRLAAIVDRCLRRDPAARFESGDALREALEAMAAPASPSAMPEGNPYRGLHRFEAEHRAVFFGRGAEVRDVVERLRAEAFVLVAGDSGVGKSSLCRAGVLPSVEDHGLDDGRPWRVARMVPGPHPLDALAAAPSSGARPGRVDASPASEPGDLVRELRIAAGETGLLLLVDQLEELVTLADPEEARRFAEALARIAAGVPGLRVVATARCDFLTKLAALPGLGAYVSRGLYLLRPLSDAGIRDAIVAPARAKGVRFESEALVDELAGAVDSAGGLPLLQFALAELWQARDVERARITEAALAALGGVAGALARHADAAVAAMLPAERAAVRAILGRLVTADGTRARRTRSELGGGDANAESALESLVRARLVSVHTSRAGDAEPVYDIAHEALLTAWPALRDWLDNRAEQRAVLERLGAAAREWQRLERGRAALWTRHQLAEARALAPAELNPIERDFLAASRRGVRRRRAAGWTLAVALPVLALAIYAGVTLQTRAELRREVDARMAEAAALLADARAGDAEVEALRARSLAAFEAFGETAEDLWAQTLARRVEVDAVYRDAAQTIEAAFALDPERGDVRGQLGRALYERALIAERDHRATQVAELIDRLAVYDPDGTYTAAWTAPASVSITTRPAGARVTLARYRTDPSGRYVLGERRALGETPLAPLALAPGSYVLEFEAADRTPVRYPFVAERDGANAIDVWLPAAGDVPAGFVYVPPGEVVIGSTDPEPIRSFLKTRPAASVAVGAFAIARLETTFDDYLRFLTDEPGAPTPGGGNRTWDASAVALRQRRDGRWELALQPAGHAYRALEGEPIRYADRSVRAEQDWRRMPVSGVSPAQAMAYAAWLARTGRVPGARLCSDLEWMRAARGADARAYPHGDRLLASEANIDATYGRAERAFGPDEVGSHPASASPFGPLDMAGNIWELTTDRAKPDAWVAMGGTYYNPAFIARVHSGAPIPESDYSSVMIGMRLCADVPPERLP